MISWKPFRYRLEYTGLLISSAFVQCLPWRWLRPLGRALGSFFFLIDQHRRKVTLANLKAAFGESISDRTLWKIGSASYGTFATTGLELLWSPRLTPDLLGKIATLEGLDPMPAHTAPGVPAIYFCLHAGNFEWMSQVHATLLTPLPVIAQKLKNPLLGPLFDRWRSTMGQRIIPQERAMLKTLRHLKEGGKIAMLIDLNLKPSEGPVVIKVFDRLLVPVTPLPSMLALRTGAALVPVECFARPTGGYHIRYLPALKIEEGSSPTSIAQACWDALEPGLRKHPEAWLWSYKHWRYRPLRGSTEHYPFYANHLESFDQLVS
ncbi:MAG: lysophospholipid acyltransferase family protein [Chthoniobacterales bacterium]